MKSTAISNNPPDLSGRYAPCQGWPDTKQHSPRLDPQRQVQRQPSWHFEFNLVLHSALLSVSTCRSALGVPCSHLSCPNMCHFKRQWCQVSRAGLKETQGSKLNPGMSRGCLGPASECQDQDNAILQPSWVTVVNEWMKECLHRPKSWSAILGTGALRAIFQDILQNAEWAPS